jgi:hypothetical protein
VIPLLAILVAVLLLPAAAHAKVTCEGPREPARDVPLRGLPDSPIAGRTYLVTARSGKGVNPTPHLGAEHCGGHVPHEATAGAGGWFRRVGDGVYELDLRFPAPGPWAVVYMDRDGRFHELGMRTVRPANGFWPAFGPALWPVEPLALLQLSTK